MAKAKATNHEIISKFAERRGGSNYQDAYRAAKRRLLGLVEKYDQLPEDYRGYLFVGACTCIEGHIKYFYAHAAQRFAGNSKLLSELFAGFSVDIETLIATNARTFDLGDVIASSIKVSSLAEYRDRASTFFSVLLGEKHDFPWDYQEIFTENNPEFKKEIALRLDRLKQAFDERHRLIHEISVVETSPTLDPKVVADDALWLLGKFEEQYWDIEFDPEFGITARASLPDGVEACEEEIDAAFLKIRSACEDRQFEALDDFKKAFRDYLIARCSFQASVFAAQRSEETMGFYIDLVPQYRQTLNHIYLEQQFLRAKYPYHAQLLEMGVDPGDL